MSALLDNLPVYRPMAEADLEVVLAIERSNYAHPWSHGNFSDSLAAGYHCSVMECADQIVGYSVMMIALDEAHLLNLCIAAPWQRRGWGRDMLNFVLDFARARSAAKIYLEVRPSNSAGIALYRSTGFSEIATRRGYYPLPAGREDAVIMELSLALPPSNSPDRRKRNILR